MSGFNSSISLWWLLWIVSNALGQVVYRLTDRAEELQDFINLNMLAQVSEVSTILLAFATLSVINTIYRAQTEALARGEQQAYQGAQQVVVG